MFEITMPKAGQSMEDGTVLRWLKAEGEAVQAGEILLEIETDKATIEVEAGHGGWVRKLLYPAGATVPVHTLIALVGQPGEDLGPFLAKAPLAAAAGAQAGVVAKTQVPPAGNVIPILMPKAGQTMEEGTILAWRVKPGDVIEKGDVIFEVETDKANIEVEATDSGRLARIVAPEGQMIEVLRPVAYIADSDADVDAFIAGHGAAVPAPPVAPAAEPAAMPHPQSAPAGGPAPATGGAVKASPAARRIAREQGIDLTTIGPGRGPGGRILAEDVAAARGSGAAASGPAAAAPGQAKRRRMSPMRKAIARSVLASKGTIPHFYMRLTVDADGLLNFYRQEKAKYPCTLNDVIALACARAIRQFPAFRSRIEGDDIIELPSANIGIAVGIDDGLVVPVIVEADAMSLRQLAAESRRIVEAARSGKLEGMGKGVFTITNLGMFGVEEFAAIINPPEAAILAVGAIRDSAIVSNGQMRPGKVMTATLSSDHRVIDGLLAAKFLARLKEILESPGQLGQ